MVQHYHRNITYLCSHAGISVTNCGKISGIPISCRCNECLPYSLALPLPMPQPTTDINLQLTTLLADAADDRKAGDICLFKVSEVTFIADYFVIVTGYSRTQVRAIADAMESRAKEEFQREPLRKEGEADRSWIVLDYGDVIAHVMLPEQREYYNLEAFWGHSEQLAFTPLAQSQSS